MDRQEFRVHGISLRDATIAALALLGVVLANIGVVRALDIALDAIHR